MKKHKSSKIVSSAFAGTAWLLSWCVVLMGLSGYRQGAALAGRAGGHNAISGHNAINRVATVGPFLHRPYYGDARISQRTVSFVDHDRPWYDSDGIFVRYDGTRWNNVSVMGCQPGTNCYDGHNGYDLNLRFEPVLSPAAGSVIRAGWYNPLNHNSSLGLWVAIDHGNGIATAYGHLSSLSVAVGDNVGVQWPLGTSGTTGSSTGPHLHMATYYMPNWQVTDPFGWTGTYTNPNVVPDRYLWVDNPGTEGTVPNVSRQGSEPYPGAALVDDSSANWSSTGIWSTDKEASDVNGNMHWTNSTCGTANATASWQPELSGDGYYEVGIFVNDTHASGSWVPYTIYSASPDQPGVEVKHTVYVDQSHIGYFQGPYGMVSTGPQWVSLGVYYFRSAMTGRVVVSNATCVAGEMIGADGAEFVPIGATPQLSLSPTLSPSPAASSTAQPEVTPAASPTMTISPAPSSTPMLSPTPVPSPTLHASPTAFLSSDRPSRG